MPFTPCSRVSAVDFEQAIVCWGMKWCANATESKHVLRFHWECQCYPHIETSQLIYCSNQLTCFYMRATQAFNGLIIVLI